MGTWRILVDGHGIHHNDKAEDADKLARKLVALLKDAGQDIHRAEFQLTDSEFNHIYRVDVLT